MKNFSKNNFSDKNSKRYKKNSDSNFNTKNNNYSKKNNRFSSNSAKNNGDSNFNEFEKKKSKFSSVKRRIPTNKTNLEVLKEDLGNPQQLQKKRNS